MCLERFEIENIKCFANKNMPDLTVPPEDMPPDAWLAYLRQTAKQDLPTARRTALLRLPWQEPYLIRAGLIARIEAIVGRGCFGSSPRAAP